MAYTTINKSGDYFNTKLYTGTATSAGNTQAITGVGFQPDLVWIKNRGGAYQHVLYDAVRGVNKEVRSSQTNAEIDSGDNGYLSGFDSDGFTTNAGTNEGNHVNNTGDNFASWNWLANGTGSANTDGSINSTVSANTTAGFSIVSYTGNATAGATIGHGLGSAPSMIIAKRRSAVENWAVYHQSMGASKYINLDTTTAEQSSTSRWNGTEPTSSVFSVNTHASVNGNGDTYIAYCFAEKKGYSKFGSYVGNSSTDGTFVYTGFKPAFVMIKRATGGTGDWQMYDNKRVGYNDANYRLKPSSSSAEATDEPIDILSNGFKLRNTGGSFNASGDDYIYMAFAENPFVTSTGIPCTAR